MAPKQTPARYAGVRKARRDRPHAGLGTRDFLRLVESAALAALPPGLARKADSRIRFSLLQLHFGDTTVHYEVWVQRRGQPAGQGVIEVGLHFEGRDGERNRALLAGLVAHAGELMQALGPRIEPEEWTKSWTRLHETLPLDAPLDARLADALGRRVARWVDVCEPLLPK
ncbi:MAG: hypothetical protein Q7T26_00845 [Dehalococcoidia bacterium]|nr:hypothetical protein [Dehalococcoidia bacterium]